MLKFLHFHATQIVGTKLRANPIYEIYKESRSKFLKLYNMKKRELSFF